MSVCEDDDLNLVISLLSEYSGKLSILVQEIERFKSIERRNLLILICLVVIGIVVTLFTVGIFSGKSDFSVAASVSAFFALSVIMLMIATIIDNARRITFWNGQAKILSVKLEKLVRFGSQTEEHRSHNSAKRIELDLRLKEAESVLASSRQLIVAYQQKSCIDGYNDKTKGIEPGLRY